VLANLTTAAFGPAWSIVNAFLFIGLDLTSRDKLHDTWHGNGLAWKMAALIAVGSLLSFALNRNAGIIALASFVAFALAAMADTLIYAILRKRNASYMRRVNGSNLAGAAVDSFVFPTLAFGGFDPWITAGQFAAKVCGGFLWSLVLRRTESPGEYGVQPVGVQETTP
jgi:uncharacterized PurR-regulated membrane protein YhhQ (DUF165 family)